MVDIWEWLRKPTPLWLFFIIVYWSLPFWKIRAIFRSFYIMIWYVKTFHTIPTLAELESEYQTRYHGV